MQKLQDIPIKIESGQKYKTKHGISAIKDGIKQSNNIQPNNDSVDNNRPRLPKPDWLRIKLESNPKFDAVQNLVQENNLSTVCAEAKCPNISECWSHGTATFMLMGAICTRACKFCSVDTGNPQGWLDHDEPEKVANSTKIMKLQYVVLTSVDRDDLADGGALHFAKTIIAIKKLVSGMKVEALTGDFGGNLQSVKTVIDSGVDVFAQNVETVERLTHPVRDNRAGYWKTINILKFAKEYNPKIITKTSLMLGLGENDDEINQTMDDLRNNQVDVLTIGQYLQPTKNHYPIAKYVTPEDFAKYRQWGLSKGFMEVASGPLVRSSYRADKIFTHDNLGL